MGHSNLLTAEAQFVGQGKEKNASKYESIFWTDKARMGVKSRQLNILEEKFVKDVPVRVE